MPNYSKARTLFSSVNKKMWEIPWADAHTMFRDIQSDLIEAKQEQIDTEYAEQIAQKEQEWSDSHEAPYEGNFSDTLSKPPVTLSHSVLEKAVAGAIKTNFIEKYKLILHMDWLMPQILTYLGNLPKYVGEDGKFCALQFRNNNFKTDAQKGLYRFLMVNERSSYLKLQYKYPAKTYCSLVPLILYAQRLVDQTPYSAWSRETLGLVVNSELAEAMLCEVPSVTREELINIRQEGMKSASGGKEHNPITTHVLYGNYQKASVIGDMPKLAKVMMTQIWCAHPDNRTKYMVLNPKNWDKMPPALIETDLFKPQEDEKNKPKLALLDDF
jgi:hypothetical protein